MNPKLRILTRTGAMTALVMLLQYLGKLIGGGPPVSTWIIGSFVNMVLFVSVVYCGLWGSLAVGALTPVMALIIGQMPHPLLIPFVALANAVLCVVFRAVLKFGRFNRCPLAGAGIAAAGVIKFVYMRFALVPLLPLLGLPQPMINTLTAAYGFIQLFAALIGGILFFTADFALGKSKFPTADKLSAAKGSGDAKPF